MKQPIRIAATFLLLSTLFLTPAFGGDTISLPDLNEKGKIGLAEAIYILQVVSGIRQEPGGASRCRDVSGIDFGPCEALLGFAVIDGQCTEISGCPPSPVPLFTNLAECRAVCTARCGGIAGLTCPDDLICIDDPTDDCDPACGGADCGGICKTTDPNMSICGGIAGFPCPDGFTCVDDPRDACSPNCGGADCSGICVGN